MCIADMAAGRRLIPRVTSTAVGAGNFLRVVSDPRRLRLILTPDVTNLTMFGYLSPDSSVLTLGFATLEQHGPAVLTVEMHGQIVMGESYWNLFGGGAVTWGVVELLADYDLDRLIQREVG